MENILVHRYKIASLELADGAPPQVGWAGYIEPKDLSWIMFVHTDGHVRVFLDRDPETGAVLPLPDKHEDATYPGAAYEAFPDTREPPYTN